VFCGVGELLATVRFYHTLTATGLDMDMDTPEAGLHVVAVGPFLILELAAEQHGLAARPTTTSLRPDQRSPRAVTRLDPSGLGVPRYARRSN
jgi:hypothetical protein